MNHVVGSAGRLHVLRLPPGTDVRSALHTWAVGEGIEAAGIVSAVGSLSRAALRYAGRTDRTMITGDLEVCACSGTLSNHGLHVHVVVADPEGRTHGGHLLDGCRVRTTLELMVLEARGITMVRTMDPATGHPELDPRPI